MQRGSPACPLASPGGFPYLLSTPVDRPVEKALLYRFLRCLRALFRRAIQALDGFNLRPFTNRKNPRNNALARLWISG
jgi:hypothetical protein